MRTTPSDARGESVSAPASVFLVREDLAGMRVDRALVELLPGLSRTRIQAEIRAGNVLLEGRVVKPGAVLEAGQRLEFVAEAPTERGTPSGATSTANRPGAEAIPLSILYEDAHLLVVDKPAGLVVHPAPGHEAGTLVNALLSHVP